MYPIANNPCLQQLSNRIVRALKSFVHRPPQIPKWVNSLPPKERQRAFDLIHKFGSPNVFERFAPHVTVGFDQVYPPVRRKHALETLQTPTNCIAQLTLVSIARVGVGGSVLQDGVIGKIPLGATLESSV